MADTAQFEAASIASYYQAIKNGEAERAKNMMAYLIDEAMAYIELKIAESELSA